MTKAVRSATLSILFFALLIIANILILRIDHRWILYLSDNGEGETEIVMDKEGIIEAERILRDEKKGRMIVTLKGLNKGNVHISVVLKENGRSEEIGSDDFVVGRFNMIFRENAPGFLDVHILKLELILLYLLLIVRVFRILKREAKETMYSYRLVTYVGIILLLGVNILGWTADVIRDGAENIYLYHVMYDTIDLFMRFSLIISPLVFLLALFLFIDSMVLIKKEGKSFTNTLGILLGLFLAGMTIIGVSLYGILDRFMDVHSLTGHYISMFGESLIYTVLAYFECMMLGTVICCKHAERHVPPLDRDYLIILGCSIRKDGTPTPLLRGRADRALWFADKQKKETGKDVCFVASGGQGTDEVVSEAEALGNYLVTKGVPKDKIILEDRSTTTRENMEFSNALIKERNKDAKIAFSTTGYHVFRSGNIAHSLGITASGMGSRTKWYFYTNALIREFLANLNIERKKHLTNIAVIFIVLSVLMQLSYMFDLI